MKSLFFTGLITGLWHLAIAAGPFAPAAGKPGSTAIYMRDPNLVAWATGVSIERGLQKIDNPSLGYASHGSPSDALGPAQGGTTTGVVSLGDGGVAVLTFPHPIANGPGWDFAVFENSHNGQFLELAFVEVSSDGIHYERFPAVSLTQTQTQVDSFGLLDPTYIHNLAGKYLTGYGAPFDLEEIRDMNPLVDVSRISHVRIIDVIGCIGDEWASYDSLGNKINDPWPTQFPTGGFDLDAVGVRYQKTLWADLNGDGIVNFQDFRLLAEQYPYSACLDDLAKFTDKWLLTESWYEALLE